MFGIGPGAARTVEPMWLVHAEETAGLFHNCLLTANGIRHGFQSAPPRRRTLVLADAKDIVIAHCALHSLGVRGRRIIRNRIDIFPETGTSEANEDCPNKI